MEKKYTKGPWVPAELYGHMTGVRAGNSDTGRWIAHAWCQTSTPGSAAAHANQVLQNEANAKLIAAAPELLEALQECVEYAEAHDAIWVADKARAAISKALGETE